jgi:hypothetical protein
MNNNVKLSNHTKHPQFNNFQKEVIKYETSVFQNSVTENSGLVGCDALLLGERFAPFHTKVVPRNNMVSNPRRPEYKITNCLINYMQDPTYTIPVQSLHKICNHITPRANERFQSEAETSFATLIEIPVIICIQWF